MIVVAIMLGLSAAFGVYRYLNQTQEQVKKLTEKRSVVIARKELSAGTRIKRTQLAIKQLPIQSVPPEYPSSPDKLLGRIVKSTVEKGGLINESKLVAQGAAAGLAVLIPEGKRAVTIKVNDASGVAGFITPGDHVDVLSIYKSSTSGEQEEKTYSKTIFQNILVLAVGDKLYDPNALSDPAAMITEQITIALDPQDTEKATLASFKSHLYLSLRPSGDKTINDLISSTAVEDIYDYVAASNNPNVVAAPLYTKSYSNSVELILGNARSYYSY